jgi:hypothetical protein
MRHVDYVAMVVIKTNCEQTTETCLFYQDIDILLITEKQTRVENEILK